MRQFLGGNGDTEVKGLEDIGAVVFTHECQFGGTCCDFECCEPGEICMEMTGPPQQPTNLNSAIAQLQIAQNGQMQFYYDFLMWNLDAVQRNDWKLPDGKPFKNRPRTCVKRLLEPLDGTRMLYRPLLSVIFILVVLIRIIAGFGCGELIKQTQNFAPLMLLFTSFALSFSVAANYAIFTTIVAAATMFWPQGKWTGWLALGQFLSLWFILGGNNLLIQGPNINYFNYMTYRQGNFNALQQTCSGYFSGYFAIGSQKNYMTFDDYWGPCSSSWIAFELMMAQTQVILLAFMLVRALMNFVIPASEPEVWCCCKKKERGGGDDDHGGGDNGHGGDDDEHKVQTRASVVVGSDHGIALQETGTAGPPASP